MGVWFAAVPLAFGHTAITAGWDVVAWLAVVLLVVRAVLRAEPRYWLAAGAVAGAATWNKLLLPLLLVSLAVGIGACGPRRLPWRHLAGAGALAMLIATPQLVHQVASGWPQLSMASALSAQSGAANRTLLVPFLVILLGPVLVPVWVAGLVGLLRRPVWRPIRFLAVAFATALLVTAATSGAPYYLLGLLAAVYAVGCVPAAEWLTAGPRTGRRGGRRRAVTGAVVANAVVSAVVGLPLVPVGLVGATPVPAANVGVRGSVGWPQYVAQVAAAWATLLRERARPRRHHHHDLRRGRRRRPLRPGARPPGPRERPQLPRRRHEPTRRYGADRRRRPRRPRGRAAQRDVHRGDEARQPPRRRRRRAGPARRGLPHAAAAVDGRVVTVPLRRLTRR